MWFKFAVGEGIMKTVSALFQKLIGNIMGTLEMGCLAAIIIGTIQMTAGFLGFAKKGIINDSSLFPDKRNVMWAIIFGFTASIFGTVWSIYTFTLGADIGIRTMLVMGSIVPGAIIGRIFWKDKLGVAETLGIIVFLSAVWAMLDFPSFKMMLQLPVWVWAVLVITFNQAANEALSRKVSNKLNIWVNNFWVGASTVFFSLAALLILAGSAGGAKLSLTNTFILGSVVIGCIVVAVISFKLLSYATGATIALKKLIMQGSYLITATFAGIIIYREPFTTGKVAGILLFLIAFVLTDEKTRTTMSSLLKKGSS